LLFTSSSSLLLAVKEDILLVEEPFVGMLDGVCFVDGMFFSADDLVLPVGLVK